MFGDTDGETVGAIGVVPLGLMTPLAGVRSGGAAMEASLSHSTRT